MLMDYMPSLLLSAIMGMIVFFVGKVTLLNTALTLVVQVVWGFVIYIASAKFVRMRELKEVVDMIRPYIKNKIVSKRNNQYNEENRNNYIPRNQ